MDKETARERYRQADQFFRAGWYEDALSQLEKLGREFPNDEHVLYARAKCLAELGRFKEAAGLCDYLVEELGYRRGAGLRRRIVERWDGEGGTGSEDD